MPRLGEGLPEDSSIGLLERESNDPQDHNHLNLDANPEITPDSNSDAERDQLNQNLTTTGYRQELETDQSEEADDQTRTSEMMQTVQAQEATEPLTFIEQYGQRIVSYGDKRGTVEQAMKECPHFKLLGEKALQGVVIALVKSEERKEAQNTKEEAHSEASATVGQTTLNKAKSEPSANKDHAPKEAPHLTAVADQLELPRKIETTLNQSEVETMLTGTSVPVSESTLLQIEHLDPNMHGKDEIPHQLKKHGEDNMKTSSTNTMETEPPSRDYMEWERQLGIVVEDKLYITPSPQEEHLLHQTITSDAKAPIIDMRAEIKIAGNDIMNQHFAEIIETLDDIEDDRPVPEFAPDAEAILAQLDFEPDEALVEFVTADADVELIDGEVLDSIAELASGEAELELSEADLQLLEEWAVLMVDAQPEDFAVSAEDEMSIHADYQEILEQIDGATDEAAAEMAADTVEAAGRTIETQAEMAGEATVESGNQEEQSVEIPAEVTPLLATAVEQISEHIALLDSEEVAETHALLADVSRELQAVEKIVLDLEAAAESVANVEEAEAVLVQSIQKLCEHIGLDYSEEQITQLVQQLLEAQVGTINLHNQTMVGSAEINQIDLNTGTHEALSWFMSSIKQLKKQTSWLHLHVLLGRRIMASLPDIYSTVQTG